MHAGQEGSDDEEYAAKQAPTDHVEATLARVHRMAPIAAPAAVKTRPGLHKPGAI